MENKIFLINVVGRIYSAFDRLINCSYPRSVGHLAHEIDNHVRQLRNNTFPDSFEAEFLDFLEEQNKYFRKPYNSHLLDKLSISPSLDTFDDEAKHFINKLLPAYVIDQEKYVTEELLSRSRKATKLKMLEEYISDCDFLSKKCNDENLTLIKGLQEWLRERQRDLISVDKTSIK